MIQLGDFVLNKELSTIIINSEEVAIEPKLLELLLLFCDSPNRIISRQEILEQIWQGGVVTDNAINKMIANLRKLLADDPRKPQYLQTVPKRGYRLICSVNYINEDEDKPQTKSFSSNEIHIEAQTEVTDEHCFNEVKQTPSLPLKKKSSLLTSYLVFFLVIACFLLMFTFRSEPTIPTTNTHTLELTRQQGIEYSPLINNAENFLLFLKKDPNNNTTLLWRKDLDSNQEYKVDNGDMRISWLITSDNQADNRNDKNQSLFFIGGNKEECQLYQAQWLSKRKLGNIESLFDCSDGKLLNIKYHKQNHQFYYSVQKEDFQPAQIYKFDIKTATHYVINQPEPLGLGNHDIDISPNGEKLLIMRSDKNYHTQLFTLDLTNQKIEAHKKFNYFVNEAIWYHDSVKVLYHAPPPSHQIISSHLNGSDQQTLVSVSEYLSGDMSLIKDKNSILFSTRTTNYNNRWLTGQNDNSKLGHSIVYDILPALLHQSEYYIFVSKRSGKSQLYYGNYRTGESRILSQLNQYMIFRHIEVSADDQFLLLTNHNKVWKLPLQQLMKDKTSIKSLDEYLIYSSEDHLTAANWLSPKLIALTLRHEGKNQLTIYDVENEKSTKMDQQWSKAISDVKNVAFVYLSKAQDKKNVYKVATSLLTTNNKFETNKIAANQVDVIALDSEYRQLKIHDDHFYFINDHQGKKRLNIVPLKSLNKSQPLSKSNKPKSIIIDDNYGYDISDAGIIISELKSREGDIHRTTRQ